MSILRDAVAARISAQRLIMLTNPGDETASALDETRFEAAVTDAQASFQRHTGIAFDSANAIHIELGINGVLCKLFRYAGSDSDGDGRSYCKRWGEALEKMRRVMPATNAVQVPTAEDADDVPLMDSSRFDDYRPDARGGGDGEE